MLEDALLAGVVKKIEIKEPKNPNKWGKTLAPWYTEECREAKRNLAKLRRVHPRGNALVVAAVSVFRSACMRGRREFANKIPDLLKY